MAAPSQSRRRWWLGIALAATLAAVAWTHAQDDGADALVQARPERAEAPRPQREAPRDDAARLRLDLLRRPSSGGKIADAFTAQSWYAPPPPPPKSLRPPPSAPPLPFAYLGQMLEDGKLTVFLTRQDRNYVVKQGDVLDGNYRVDAIEPPVMTLTYLPLNIKQTIRIGGLQ